MPRLILFLGLSLILLSTKCEQKSTPPDTNPSPGASATRNLQTNYVADSLWWGVWREDSLSDNKTMVAVAPLYYYFLPNKNCIVTSALEDSISGLDRYKKRHDFFVRNDSVFQTNTLKSASGNVEVADLLFKVEKMNNGKAKVIFPNNNKGWLSQIRIARRGSDYFIKP